MKALKRAVELKPEIVTAWVGLALLCKGAGEFAEALEACACAEALEPGRVDVGNARAELYLAQGDLDAALKGFDRVLAQLPSTEEAHNGRGNVLCGLGRGAEARAAYDAAIAINPEFPDPYFNRGLLALCEGRWSEGWPDYERRWQTRQMGPFQRGFAQQQWDGADRPDQTLLLHAEQCMGDTMQFIRYAPLAAERVGRVVLESQAPLA
jgi:tetratricopeptide (TPR) repeat protein